MTTTLTYASQLNQLNQSLAAQAPADLLNGLSAAADRLGAIDFAARTPQPGDLAEDFALPDPRGQTIHLSALLRTGPVVLIFYRGEWCPYCNLQLRTFQAHLDELTARRAQLVGISPQTPDHSLSMAEKNELGFLVLSDVGAMTIECYGLRYEVDAELRALLETAGSDLAAYNGDGGWVLPAAATFVIGGDGRVRYARVSGNWTERAEPSEVLAALDELASRRAA
jgi:peroxiredoxin